MPPKDSEQWANQTLLRGFYIDKNVNPYTSSVTEISRIAKMCNKTISKCCSSVAISLWKGPWCYQPDSQPVALGQQHIATTKMNRFIEAIELWLQY